MPSTGSKKSSLRTRLSTFLKRSKNNSNTTNTDHQVQTHVYLVHHRDHNTELALENANPTRVFYDRERAIACAKEIWTASQYSFLTHPAYEFATQVGADGYGLDGRTFLLSDDVDGTEQGSHAKVWVERRAVEDAGTV